MKAKSMILFITLLLASCTTSSHEFSCGKPEAGLCASLDTINDGVDNSQLSNTPITDTSSRSPIWVAPYLDEQGYHSAHYLTEISDALF